MIRKICLDMDGVLNRFQFHLMKHLGFIDFHEGMYPIECGWDIVAAANVLAGEQRWSKSQFWNSVTREVWATVPKSDEFDLIINRSVELVGEENVIILSSPTLDPECLAGKAEWIRDYCPKFLHRQFLIGPPKTFCATPDTLLIDDADKNYSAFIDAGGKALLVPRPWNGLHGVNAALYLDHNLTPDFENGRAERLYYGESKIH